MYEDNNVSLGTGMRDVRVQALTGSTFLLKTLRGRYYVLYASKLMHLPELFLHSKYVLGTSFQAQ